MQTLASKSAITPSMRGMSPRQAPSWQGHWRVQQRVWASKNCPEKSSSPGHRRLRAASPQPERPHCSPHVLCQALALALGGGRR